MCIALLRSLFSCRKKKPQILDGPDMAYIPRWTEFTISRSDSYAQHNFSFTVTEADPDPLASGVCRDEDGNEYGENVGIPISVEDLWKLRWLNLEQLPDEKPWPKDLPQPLDMATVKLKLLLSNGAIVKKNISSNLSLEIYQLLLPYFVNKQS